MNMNKILCQRFSFDKKRVTVGSVLTFSACYVFLLCIVICATACVINGAHLWITDFSYAVDLGNTYPDEMSQKMVFDFISVMVVTGIVVLFTGVYGSKIVNYVFDIEIVHCKRKQP